MGACLKRLMLENPNHCRVLMLCPPTPSGRERQAQGESPPQRHPVRLGVRADRRYPPPPGGNCRWQNTPDYFRSGWKRFPGCRRDPGSGGTGKSLPLRRSLLPILNAPVATICPTSGLPIAISILAGRSTPDETVQSIPSWRQLFGSLDTDSTPWRTFSREMRSLVRGHRFMIEATAKRNAPDLCRTFLCVSLPGVPGREAWKRPCPS